MLSYGIMSAASLPNPGHGHTAAKPSRHLTGLGPPSQVSLTKQERAILAVLPTGATTAQMAQHLAIQPTTVRTYLQRLYRKTGTSSRSTLVWWWAHQREGLTEKTAKREGLDEETSVENRAAP